MHNVWLNPLKDGIITSTCGKRINPILNKEELHNGIDIAAPEGTEAFAVKNGVVTNVYTSNTYGNCIKYKTEDGYEIMYAHLQKALVKKGDKIKAGEKIALVGNTGLSTGSHLHYTIEKEGQLINPIDFVSFPYSQEVKNELNF